MTAARPSTTWASSDSSKGRSPWQRGYGFLEYMPYEDGKLMNPNLVDYKMIRATEMPNTPIAEIDTYEPDGPYGAKEAGEGLTNPTAAAIGNALFRGSRHPNERMSHQTTHDRECSEGKGREGKGRRRQERKKGNKGGDLMNLICPACKKEYPSGLETARHIMGNRR